MDRDAPEVREDPSGVHRDPTALAVEVKKRPGVVAGHVDPMQPASDPATGLVEVRDAGRGELLPGGRQEPIQASGCVRQQRGQPPGGDRRAEGFLQALGGAFHRQVLAAQQYTASAATPGP